MKYRECGRHSDEEACCLPHSEKRRERMGRKGGEEKKRNSYTWPSLAQTQYLYVVFYERFFSVYMRAIFFVNRCQ